MTKGYSELFQSITAPRRVAVVGASSNPDRIGGRPIAYSLQHGFEGDLIPVNPKSDIIQGLRARPTIEAIDGEIDLAVIAVPSQHVAGAVVSAARKGAKAAMIFSSGFAEVGGPGVEMQSELLRLGREHNIRLAGPNCIGLINSRNGFNPTFTGTAQIENTNPGGFTIIGQSGSYAAHTYLSALNHGARPGLVLSTGNEADLDTSDFIKMAVRDAQTDVIGCYAEGVKDGAKLIEALEEARRARKPVLFMKVGRSSIGAEAVASHTASLAGEDLVFDSILAQFGAERVHSTEHMVDVAKAAIPKIYPSGKNLAVVTVSGGAGVLMADVAEDEGIEMPPLPREKAEHLLKLNPMASMRNPLDVTAHILNDPTVVGPTFTALTEDNLYDAVIAFWSTTGLTAETHRRIIAEVEAATKDTKDQLLVHCINPIETIAPTIREQGLPVFEEPPRAVKAVASLMRLGRAFNRKTEDQVVGVKPVELPRSAFGEKEAKKLLADAGLPMVVDVLAKTPAEAKTAAKEFGCQTAIKIASPDILHKSDIGGVALNVPSERVEEVTAKMLAEVSSACPNAKIDGVLISPMVGDGADCILGARRDPTFGMIIVFGLGGIFTEVLNDVVIRKAPVSQKEARRMIEQLRGVALLEGVRGQPAANKKALTNAIVAFSKFVAGCGEELESVEINPLRALENQALGLDALIEMRTAE